jgi:mRNA-degrading endonuclease RelE of RelBE toxin-antitoxin system
MEFQNLQELIEKKVDDKISHFSKQITNQVMLFLKENGDKTINRIYQVSEWHEGEPLSYNASSEDKFRSGLQFGIAKEIRDKMIATDSKRLFEKLQSLI